MSKLKKKLGRRIMAVALSVAMIMSNMTVYANELSESSESQTQESVMLSEDETVDEETVEETVNKDTGTSDKVSLPEKSSESDEDEEEEEDNDKTTVRESSLRVEKEAKEETASDVDNKAALENGVENIFYNNTSAISTLTNFTFNDFEDVMTQGHGPKAATDSATVTFTVPGESSQKVNIEVVTCGYGSTDITVQVGDAEVEEEQISTETANDDKKDNGIKYTISEVVGGSTVTLTLKTGGFIHSIKATIQQEVVITGTVADNTTIDFSTEAQKKEDNTLVYQGPVGNETSGNKFAVDGFAFTGFTWHGDNHGICEAGTIELNLESGKRAIITVTGCGYSNSSPKVATDSGVVLPETKTEGNLAGDNVPAPVYTIAGAEGKTTLTFTGKHYLHEMSVKYLTDDEYIVLVSADENGTASADIGYYAEKGETVTLTAVPNPSYGLKEWQIVKPEGTFTITPDADNKNVATFTMPESDVEVKAVFEAVGEEHSITVEESVENGSVEAGNVTTALAGVTINMDDVATATPDAGYMLKEWRVTYTDADGATQNVEVTKSSGKYSFVMPDADIIITVAFEEKPVTYFTTTFFNEKFIGTGTSSAPQHAENDPVDDIDGLEVVGGTVAYHDKDHGLTVSNGQIKLTLTPGKKYDLTVWGCMYGTAISMPEDTDPKAIPGTGDNTEDPLKKETGIKKYTILNVENEVTLTFDSSGSFVHGIILTESSGVEKYEVTVTDDGHGTAAADNVLAEADTEITLTATPDNRYQFKEWKVISGNVTIENNKFKMPESAVEIQAIFEPIVRRDWDFANDADLKGDNGATVSNKTETVADLSIDATASGSGWDSTGTGTDGAVAKNKTKITVSVEGACEIKISAETANYTVDGKAASAAEETFDCEGTDGKVVIEMTADNHIKAINVTPIYYVAAGTYNFGTIKDLKLDGFSFENIVHAGNSHGCETSDANASITLNLSNRANVTVLSCRYGAVANGEDIQMTATSGEVVKSNVDESGADAPEFTVRKADAGELTLTFNNQGTLWFHSIAVEYIADETPDVYTDGIDVWDFGAEQLQSTDTVKYNNKLTKDIINSWYPGVAPGTNGVNITSFEVLDADGNVDFMFNDGGYAGTHRLRSKNTELTRWDDKDLTVDKTTYNGYIYSNKSTDKSVYIGVKLNAGDIMTAVVSSNGTDYTITVEDPEGGVQNFAKPAGASIITYYATESGMHKIYNGTDEKLVVARVTRQHNQKVTVSGNVTLPRGESEDNFTLEFTCRESGMVRKAQIEDGKYEVELYENYHYDVVVYPTTYVISEGAELTLGAANETLTAEHNVTVETVSLHKLSGSIKGLEDDAAAKAALQIHLVKPEDKLYQPQIIIADDMTYEAELESGVSYEIVTEGINDYELDSTAINNSEIIRITTDTKYRNITYVKKPVYKVTIAPKGATLADLSNATFIFTNLNEEGYVYTFTGTDNIELRDGTYRVEVENSGAFIQQLTSNLVVNGANVTKEIPFKSDITEWIFKTSEGFTAEKCNAGNYNGLILTGVSGNESDKGHAVLSAGSKIEIPVKAACVIEATYYYAAAGTLGDVEFTVHEGQAQGTTGSTETVSYAYTGTAGYVELTTTGTTYLTKISIKTEIPYQSEITVDPSAEESNTNFTTINDALDAVRNMSRTEDNVTKPVTIKIAPGNYEEMLVIDVDNVKLVNAAGANASIGLKNKGVDIDANAVRITSYYGHGYSYYSMGNDCKWDEEVLKVNKENGFESYTNPGSGTTNGSYWNATVVIDASNVSAEGIIFENSFNQYISKKAAEDVIVKQSSAKEGSVPRASMAYGDTTVQGKAYVERAAALAITNNRSQISFDNCKFIGHQDTLYGGTGVTAAFYGCSVYGGTDYIFGGMKAVFAKCDLVFNTGEDTNDVGYITAPQQSSGRGYLMYNCHVTSTVPGVDTASKYTSKPGYLGRPWQAHTGEAVFYMTIIDEVDTYWQNYYASLAEDNKDKILSGKSLIAPIGWDKSLSDISELSQEYGTYEVSGVDNSAERADWAAVLEEAKLVSGEDITVATFLGDWDALSGKDMTIVMPDDENMPAPAAPKVLVTPEPDEGKIIIGSEIVLSAEAGAKVYYSIDSDETLTVENGTLYSEAIKVADTDDHTITVNAIAQKYGQTSEVTTVTYTITAAPKPAKPEISVTPAAVNGDVKVGSRLVMTSVSGADIYYNVNSDTDPATDAKNKYTGGKAGIEITKDMVTADSTITVKAVALQYGQTSDVETFTAEVAVSAPTADYRNGFQFSDGGGTVKLTSDEGTTIYYTISSDGEPDDPTLAASNPITYDADKGIEIVKDTNIKAVAKRGPKYSEVVSLSYIVNLNAPEADPVSGTKFTKEGGTVKLSADEGSTIYYTIGENPTNPIEDTDNRMEYDKASDGITVSGNVSINAVAEKDGRYSTVVTFVYMVVVSFAETPVLESTGDLDQPKEGDVLTLNYKLDTEGTDASVIRWYRISDDGEMPLDITGKEYTITAEDAGCYIEVEVTPNVEGGTAGIAETARTGVVKKTTSSGDGGSSGGDNFAESDDKLKADEDEENHIVDLGDSSKITVEAANLIATKKQQWKVTVTYTHKASDGTTVKQELTEGVHYNVVLVSGDGISGEQKIVVKGTENDTDLGKFTGTSKAVSYTLISKTDAASYKDITKAIKGLKTKTASYTGTYITPEIDWKETVDAANYTIVYKNNVNVGKGSVTVIGRGEYYGSKTLTFTIKATSISTAVVSSTNLKVDLVGKKYSVGLYDSKDYKEDYTEEYYKEALTYKGDPIVFDGLSLNVDGTTLKRGIDYTITYKNNAKVGKATATIKAMNNFTGSIKLDYTIVRTEVTKEDIEQLVDVSAEYTAKKGPLVLEIPVNGVTLKAGTDFKADYKNIKADIKSGLTVPNYTNTITIKGAGAYKDIGSATLNIKVVEGFYHIKSGVVIDQAAVTKAGTDMKKLIAATKITDAGGTKPAAEDIAKIETTSTTVTVTPADTTKFKETSIPCHVATKLSSAVKQKKAIKTSTDLWERQEMLFDGVNKVTLTTEEIVGHYLEAKTGEYNLKADDIIIVSYKNNHKVGSATVTIQATDASPYQGTLTVKFKIVTVTKPTMTTGEISDTDESETEVESETASDSEEKPEDKTSSSDEASDDESSSGEEVSEDKTSSSDEASDDESSSGEEATDDGTEEAPEDGSEESGSEVTDRNDDNQSTTQRFSIMQWFMNLFSFI